MVFAAAAAVDNSFESNRTPTVNGGLAAEKRTDGNLLIFFSQGKMHPTVDTARINPTLLDGTRT